MVPIGVAKKTAIKYRDQNGILRTKNCGTAESVRECISWIKRQGFEVISKNVVDSSSHPRRGQTKPR